MTPKLEELILSGQAEYRNYSGFASAAFTVPCPSGKQIIITDLELTAGSNFSTVIPSGLFFLKLYGTEQGGENIVSFFMPATDRNNLIGCNQYSKNVYFIYNSDCRIDIAIMLVDPLPVVDFTPMPVSNKDKPAPNGYGNTIPVIRSIDLTGTGDFYLPQGIEGSGFTPITAGMKNQPFPAIIGGSTAMPAFTLASESFCVNIGYVILNKPLIPKL